MRLSDRRFAKGFTCIVGAPRTGTTSLAHYMRSHPAIQFSKLKEPHFFSQHDLKGIDDEALQKFVIGEYLERFFPDRGDDPALLAEGSVSYLYTPERMEPILRLWPKAKFIIGVRDPAEMIPSLHQRLLVTGDEDVQDFEQAWRLVSERKHGRHVPRSCMDPRWLRYDELGKLGVHVDRFISAVGLERCIFVVHDDLKVDPAGVYRRVLEFLDLPPQPPADTSPRRVGRAVRHGWLQRLLMRPPLVTRKLLAGSAYRQRMESVDRLRGKNSLALRTVERARKRLLKWNEADAVTTPLSPALRSEFRMLFRDDIRRLEKIVGRDFSHWLS